MDANQGNKFTSFETLEMPILSFWTKILLSCFLNCYLQMCFSQGCVSWRGQISSYAIQSFQHRAFLHPTFQKVPYSIVSILSILVFLSIKLPLPVFQYIEGLVVWPADSFFADSCIFDDHFAQASLIPATPPLLWKLTSFGAWNYETKMKMKIHCLKYQTILQLKW